MKSLVAWFARNSVAANLLMLGLVVAGIAALPVVKMELFPEFSMDAVSVTVVYPGASPDEIEEGICIKVEEEVHGIEGVKKVSSTAVEGLGTVLIEVRPDADPRRVLDDVKTRVDAIDSFPDEAEHPVIQEILMRRQVIDLAIFGDVEEAVVKRIAERVRDEVNALPGVSQVELANVRPYEVSIEVPELALREHGLTLDGVAQAIRRSSIDLSGGSVKTDGGEILLRTDGQAEHREDFERIVLMTRPDGSRLELGDVARVVDGFEDTDQAARFNGKRVATIQVYRVGDESALQIADAVRGYLEEARAWLPDGVRIEPWQDAAKWLEGRLELLLRNGLQGLLLVFAILALFLRFRLSFWVTLGIPISFLGALAVMPWMDVSINMLSLFAFILVLGIVVDDAIVVGENVFKEHERGNTGVDGSVRGVREVAVPVVFAVLTTVAAFTPMLGLPGMIGKFFKVIPLAAIPALLFSLVESQLILPAHLAHESAWVARVARVVPFRWWTAFQGRVSDALLAFVDRVYRPTLARALEWRYATAAGAVGTLFLTAGLVEGGFVRFAFFNDIEGDIVAAQLRMPEGASVAVTEAAVERIERAAQELRAELERDGQAVVKNFLASVGEQPFLAAQRNDVGSAGGITGPHLAEVVMELVPSEERDVSSAHVVRRWRELTGPIPGAVALSFNAALMSAGKPIDLRLAGSDVASLRAAADELETALEEYEGVFDVTDSFRGGKEELVLDILPRAEALGLSLADLAHQVRQGFYGEEAQRLQRGRDDVKVMVRYPAADRRSLHTIESMRIRTPEGAEVPFSTVARATSRRGTARIERTDRRRTIEVTADLDTSTASANDVIAHLRSNVLPGILARHPTITYSLEGQQREQADLLAQGGRMLVLALLAIYALMAVPFKSYLQPLIVMTAIPFGLVGAILGHMLLGVELSVLSLCGIAALAGVVVNDSLVLVDFVNRSRAEGMSVAAAARRAGVERFRPILLTSLTTFAGLTPLMLERSVQAQFLIPMAISLAFGVLFSTLISLLLVPCGYLILEDLARAWRWLYGAPRESSGEAVPISSP